MQIWLPVQPLCRRYDHFWPKIPSFTPLTWLYVLIFMSHRWIPGMFSCVLFSKDCTDFMLLITLRPGYMVIGYMVFSAIWSIFCTVEYFGYMGWISDIWSIFMWNSSLIGCKTIWINAHSWQASKIASERCWESIIGFLMTNIPFLVSRCMFDSLV